MKKLNVSILGCGWLGIRVLVDLVDEGYRVKASSRSQEKLERIVDYGGTPFRVDLPETVPEDFFHEADVLIITLPPRARALGPHAALEAMTAALSPLVNGRTPLPPSAHVIFTSSTSVYGDREGRVNEEVAPDLFSAPSAQALTVTETQLRVAFPKFTCLRLAGLVGLGRHPGNFYGRKSRPIPKADAPVNLVHGDDVSSAIKLIIKTGAVGTYNVCAAAHPTKGEFYTAAAKSLGLEVAGTTPGGADGKVIDSAKLRALGWQPKWDDLSLGMGNK